jgi:hypothetical protein
MSPGAAATNVNPPASKPLCPSVLITTTLTVPVACAGVTAVSDVPFVTLTLVAAVPPMETLAPARNPVPDMVTEVPPLALPEFGVTEVTVGAGTGVW